LSPLSRVDLAETSKTLARRLAHTAWRET
jgi:hypothetical protein